MSTFYIVLQVEDENPHDRQTEQDVAVWLDVKLGRDRPVQATVFENLADMVEWEGI